jgi:hypothetical protein
VIESFKLFNLDENVKQRILVNQSHFCRRFHFETIEEQISPKEKISGQTLATVSQDNRSNTVWKFRRIMRSLFCQMLCDAIHFVGQIVETLLLVVLPDVQVGAA